MRYLRKPVGRTQGCPKNADGKAVFTEERAQTFADYLETVRWKVRPATLIIDPPLFPELAVDLEAFSLKELRLAIEALRANKAAGPDSHPLEFWKVIVDSPGPIVSEGASWLLELCNKA